jgi:hypothetical protein
MLSIIKMFLCWSEKCFYLIEKIDAQNTLHGPIVLIADLSNLKITIGDARKMPQLVPLLSTQQHINNLEAKRVIIIANKSIQQEQLTHGIREPQRLHEHVQDDQIVAESFARPKANRTQHDLYANPTLAAAYRQLRTILTLLGVANSRHHVLLLCCCIRRRRRGHAAAAGSLMMMMMHCAQLTPVKTLVTRTTRTNVTLNVTYNVLHDFLAIREFINRFIFNGGIDQVYNVKTRANV